MTKLKALLGVLLVVGVALAAFPMAGSAGHSTNSELQVEYHNSTYAVDNDTQSVYMDIEDTNGTTLHAYVYGIDSGGNLTEVHNETVSSTGALVTVEHPVNATLYDEYRVVLEGDDTTEAPAFVESGLISKLAGGGGVTLNSTFLGLPLWAGLGAMLVVGGLGVALYRGDI